MIYKEEFTFFGGEVGGFKLNGGWVFHNFLVKSGSESGVVGQSSVEMVLQFVSEFVEIKCSRVSVDLVLFRMYSLVKFLLVSLIIPLAGNVPGNAVWRLRECAFMKRLVVCWPKPLGTRMVIVLAKQCFLLLTWR